MSFFQYGQEIWLLLEITDESTNQVKQSKITNLTYKYESFQNKVEIKSVESISIMYNLFNEIIVGLEGLGKKMSKVELNRKLL